MQQVIRIHAEAPAKPSMGATCNGCGVCCASEPCPIGILVSRRRHGACEALLWDDAQHRYLCGMVTQPSRYIGAVPPWMQRLLSRVAIRMIAAGRGCDCDTTVDDLD